MVKEVRDKESEGWELMLKKWEKRKKEKFKTSKNEERQEAKNKNEEEDTNANEEEQKTEKTGWIMKKNRLYNIV